MRIQDLLPGMEIRYEGKRLIVFDCYTGTYDEDIGMMTAVTCFEEASDFEYNLVFEPDHEVEVIN